MALLLVAIILHNFYLFISLKKRKEFLVNKLCHLICIKKLILDPVYVYIKMCSTASHNVRLCAVLVLIIINQFSFMGNI